LVGSLIGSKKQSTTSEIDYVKLRQNAEAAGFNPLTALRAGGGAGFTTTHHPSLASGGFMADALSNFGSALGAAIDPMRDATAKLEYQIKQETLKNLQADTAARKRASLGGVPVSTGARNVKANSPLQRGLPASAGVSLTPTVEVPTLTNPWPMSWGLQVNPNAPDAQAIEDRYGDSEILSTIYGVYQLGSDLLYSKNRSIERETKDALKNYPAKVKRNAARESRIRADALKNAKDLGFKLN